MRRKLQIALIGYGKMGKTVESEAQARGHEISHIIDIDNQDAIREINPKDPDVVIDFTSAEGYIDRMKTLIPAGVPIVSGTTGWYQEMDTIREWVAQSKGSFLFGSNFSIGVNILFQINQHLAKLMNQYEQYDCFIEERHHKYKSDAPSGTAITLGEQILTNLDRKSQIVTGGLQTRKPERHELSVGFIRSGEIFGNHQVSYTSPIDTIRIEHSAHNRKGFGLGAVIAAEWLVGKTGFFNFTELFKEV